MPCLPGKTRILASARIALEKACLHRCQTGQQRQQEKGDPHQRFMTATPLMKKRFAWTSYPKPRWLALAPAKNPLTKAGHWPSHTFTGPLVRLNVAGPVKAALPVVNWRPSVIARA